MPETDDTTAEEAIDDTAADDSGDTAADDQTDGAGDDTAQGDGSDDDTAADGAETDDSEGDDSADGAEDDDAADSEGEGEDGGSEPADEVEPGADPLAAEYEATLREIDSDESLSAAERRIKKLQVLEMRESRQERRIKAAKAQEDAARNKAARTHGVSREILEACWARAVKQAKTQPGGFDQGVAMYLLRQEIGKVKARKVPAPGAKGKKPVSNPSSLAAASRALPRVKTNKSGARLVPPGGGGGGRATKPKLSAEEAFDQGDWD